MLIKHCFVWFGISDSEINWLFKNVLLIGFLSSSNIFIFSFELVILLLSNFMLELKKIKPIYVKGQLGLWDYDYKD